MFCTLHSHIEKKLTCHFLNTPSNLPMTINITQSQLGKICCNCIHYVFIIDIYPTNPGMVGVKQRRWPESDPGYVQMVHSLQSWLKGPFRYFFWKRSFEISKLFNSIFYLILQLLAISKTKRHEVSNGLTS